LVEKDKIITDIKNQQTESKRVELITLQKNLEEKFKLELEQVKSENQNKLAELRRKNENTLQKALTQQKEELEALITTNVKEVDNTTEEKLKQSNDIIKQKNRDISQLEDLIEKKRTKRSKIRKKLLKKVEM